MTEDMFSTTALRERGWTPAMIRDLLGDPDALRPNPFYRSAAPMRLWSAGRVSTAEAGDGFAARLARGKVRSESAVKVAEKRRQQLLAEIVAVAVTVPELDDATLAAQAITHRNEHMAFHASGALRDNFESANPDAPEAVDSDTLDRWKVNYLRHILTDYERHLMAVAGQVGVRDAKEVIREKVYDAISDAYPKLSAECRKQKDRRSLV